jgi:hypothetical protein
MENRKFRIKIKKTGGYALKRWWFYALMASESYVLAHAFREGRLSTEQIASLPWDFSRVLQTYDNFGWVGNITFTDWLNRKDKVLFRTEKQLPSVSTITRIPRGDTGDPNKIIDDVMKHLYGTRDNQNFPNALLLSIPLNLSKQSIFRQIAQKIDVYKQSPRKASHPVDLEIPLYRFRANKLKTTAFDSSLKTLHKKIRNHEWPLWKVGTEVNLNEDAAVEIRKAENKKEEIKKATGKRPKPEDNAYLEKMTMNTLVHRQIKYALLLAENAARGRFPSIDPIVDKNGKDVKLIMDYPFMNAEYAIAEAEFYERYPQPEIV